ncbi:unnamed protein product [Phyllotreta striolata]|uniref:Activating transcription factor 7-interacting protein Fn3 domain-containing protein n=1 Tax=Phyllotreta striolata TaxID=444603 RepID=A0A9N9XJ12_PHYSR|nr:unnamed protein product [Phyllotreta striolata]
MTSTLEPCESQSTSGSLSSTLEIFDKFKSVQSERESDEESFHIPLLGGDDETESSKENVNESDTSLDSANEDVSKGKEKTVCYRNITKENEIENDLLVQELNKYVNNFTDEPSCTENSNSLENAKINNSCKEAKNNSTSLDDNKKTEQNSEALDVKIPDPNENPKESDVSNKDINITETEKKSNITESTENLTVPQEISEEPSNKKESSNIDPQEESNNQPSNSEAQSYKKDLDREDLLDISVIRDVEEDDACAIAAETEKSSDTDDQEDKQEPETDDMELEPEDTQTSSEKVEYDELGEENTSDIDQKDNDCTIDELVESNSNQSVVSEKISEAQLEENDDSKNEGAVKSSTPVTELNENSVNANKRPLEEEGKDSTAKKVRLDETQAEPVPPKTLITFEKYMKMRNLGEKMVRSDVEQFALQKMCEALLHKTPIGELEQIIKKQKMIIDNLRKDNVQMTKQFRDLEIVHKKLLNEIQNTAPGSQSKPLVPLKITRSVGLQVKLSNNPEILRSRKAVSTTSPRSQGISNGLSRTRPAASSNVARQAGPVITSNSPRKQAAPILSQALQSRVQPSPTLKTTATSPNSKRNITPLRPKQKEPAKQQLPPGVIDLTDEDDRTGKTLGRASIQMVKNFNLVTKKSPLNKNNVPQNNLTKPTGISKIGMQPRSMTTLPQGVRLTAAQMKGGITLPNAVVTNAQGTTQLMYVVQPGSLVNTTAGGGQKTVLLNFQPTNGVLTSTLNGSTVSVIPTKSSNAIQLKPISHPAPLPPTPKPLIASSSLKKLLPKPHLSIKKTDTGIILQWRMPYNLDEFESIASYQLFAYQETNAPPSTDMWRKVGDVKALQLPMACTLTQFADKNKYYFAVRSVDIHKRIGAFSDPEEISL